MITTPQSAPSAVQYGNEIHVFCIGTNGALQENVFSSALGCWIPVQLTGVGGTVAGAPNPVAGCVPVPVVSGPYLNVCYRDAAGNVHDLVRAGAVWARVAVAGPGGAPGAPLAAGIPKAVIIAGFFNCVYRAVDGNIWSVSNLGTRWLAVQMTGAGGKFPLAAKPAGDPSVVISGNDTMCAIYYRGTDLNILSLVLVTGVPHSSIALPRNPDNTSPASDPVCIAESNFVPPNTNKYGNNPDHYNGHFLTYRDTAGKIWAYLFQGPIGYRYNDSGSTVWTYGTGSWKIWAINGGGKTTAPLAVASAVGDPFVTNALGGYVLTYYVDAVGNLICVPANNYTLGGTLSLAKTLANAFVSGTYLTLGALSTFGPAFDMPTKIALAVGAANKAVNVAVGQYGAQPFKPDLVTTHTDYSMMALAGPNGVNTAMPAASGPACAVPVGVNDVFMFYRATDANIYCLASHFENSTATVLVGTV